MKGPRFGGNDLTPHQIEALHILQEECAEVIKACSKIDRMGLNYHRYGGEKTNQEALEEEVRDVLVIFNELYDSGVLSTRKVYDGLEWSNKLERLRKNTNFLGQKLEI